MFIPYRCWECNFGMFVPNDDEYDCSLGVSDDDECEENFEGDWSTKNE